ncbi:MAG: hypothetical protein SFU86_18540 [Pirellulaceae bacterium]|nr:hypothetical protein [Pirellulaceae bacterium]
MNPESPISSGTENDVWIEHEVSASRTICEAFIARGDIRLTAGRLVDAVRDYEAAMLLNHLCEEVPCPAAACERHESAVFELICLFEGRPRMQITIDAGFLVVMDGNVIQSYRRSSDPSSREMNRQWAIDHANELAADIEQRSILDADGRIAGSDHSAFVFEHDGTTPVLIHKAEPMDES